MVKIFMERKTGDYGFTVQDEKGNVIKTDSSTENGGADSGFRPMQLLLAALGGCSAIDIVAILKKQRQEVSNFSIQIEGEREAGKVPSLWKKVHLNFIISGNINEMKLIKAADLSLEKYCSVAETLRRAGAEITWQVTKA